MPVNTIETKFAKLLKNTCQTPYYMIDYFRLKFVNSFVRYFSKGLNAYSLRLDDVK